MPLNDFQKGYLAGLLDGEGSITIYKNTEKRGKNKRTRSKLGFTLGQSVKISNTNLELLNAVNQIALGRIYKGSSKFHLYYWQISDKKKIVELLEQVLPYLIVKKDRAIKMIEFCKSRLNRPHFKSGYTLSEIGIAENWSTIPKNCGKELYESVK